MPSLEEHWFSTWCSFRPLQLTSRTSRLSLSPSLISVTDRAFFAAAFGVIRGLKVHSSQADPPPLLPPAVVLAGCLAPARGVAGAPMLLPPPLLACVSDSCCRRCKKSGCLGLA
jgi:hypothetical protein